MNITSSHEKVYDPIFYMYEALNLVYIALFIYLGLRPNKVNEVVVRMANNISKKLNNNTQSGGKGR
jgi:hypothetical protein